MEGKVDMIMREEIVTVAVAIEEDIKIMIKIMMTGTIAAVTANPTNGNDQKNNHLGLSEKERYSSMDGR